MVDVVVLVLLLAAFLVGCGRGGTGAGVCGGCSSGAVVDRALWCGGQSGAEGTKGTAFA